MTPLHTAARMALDALEAALSDDRPYIERCKAAVTALREAIAAPMPEPVAYRSSRNNGKTWIITEGDPTDLMPDVGGIVVPLYAAPPAAPAPVVPAECCRNELLTALHSLASNYENALGMFGQDGEGRRKAEGDLAHAMKVAAKHNRNGPGCAAPVVPDIVNPITDEQINDIWNAKDLPEHRSHLSPWGMDRIRAIIAAANGIRGGAK